MRAGRPTRRSPSVPIAVTLQRKKVVIAPLFRVKICSSVRFTSVTITNFLWCTLKCFLVRCFFSGVAPHSTTAATPLSYDRIPGRQDNSRSDIEAYFLSPAPPLSCGPLLVVSRQGCQAMNLVAVMTMAGITEKAKQKASKLLRAVEGRSVVRVLTRAVGKSSSADTPAEAPVSDEKNCV